LEGVKERLNHANAKKERLEMSAAVQGENAIQGIQGNREESEKINQE